MSIHLEVSAPVVTTARVQQLSGLFDVPLTDRQTLTWDVDLPVDERPWQVGLVVGPSGSGKTTLASTVWPGALAGEYEWPAHGSLLDGFPAGMGVRDIVAGLGAVGLNSPPAWLRPYRTLSNGEAFRASMARLLAETADRAGPVVVDEFTSVVDRHVAQVASHTVQKTVRRLGRQLVAVTCHYDVEDWLQPDWVLDMAGPRFTWRSVQPRPELELRIYPVDRAVWSAFRRHHYLSKDIHVGARCFGGWIGEDLVGFTSYLHLANGHRANLKLAHRTVVLPDWQGLGIGNQMAEWVGLKLWREGQFYRRSIAHPAVIAWCARSPRWKDVTGTSSRRPRTAGAKRFDGQNQQTTRRFSQRSFEYTAPAGVVFGDLTPR